MRFTRLLSILTVLALLLAPAGMLSSHAAMAMPDQAAASAIDHCASPGETSGSEDKRAMIDCAIACAAMPAAEPLVADQSILAASPPALASNLFVEGMRPEAATPPPRFS